jgi:hypothetical protein
MLLHGSFTGSYRGQANFPRHIKIYIAGCDIKVSPDQIGLAKGAARGRRSAVKRRILAAIAAAVLSLGVAAPMAYADPDFGPGNSSKGPNDGGAKCHPPGTTKTESGCK